MEFTEVLTFEVGNDFKNLRLDKFLSIAYPEFSRSYLSRLIEEGFVKVNGQVVKKPSKRLKGGEIVELFIPKSQQLELKPEPLPIEIIYEDNDLAVVYKPPGMVVHPSPGHERGTLVNALLYHLKSLSSIGGEDRPGIVHRLDRGTTGIMVVAKNDKAHRNLSKQFSERRTDKRYLALVTPPPRQRSAVIDLPIGRSISDRKKFSVFSPKGKSAKTEYTLKELFEPAQSALLDIKIYTGRTHQIRVHLKSQGMTIWGDTTYGFKKSKLPPKVRELCDLLPEGSFWLFAYRLGFYHPSTQKWVEFTAQPPRQYLEILNRLRKLKD
ncbi:MAG TPA: RluA family pseudouridine synthase [Aquifex aeolicus]|uniref:Pseudouridine synthase n=1 Tax=Aquifex aeolicus TaxID=63363 RepID=A0A9D1CFU0_AQUAO|nr:RluA family pseudouridine synthase [Aquificales bacterium]HIP86015.1 RluA family pseudouridine synthase [Aquifex sp.]HIP98786.1 RluA family pseudouridine synthase [Aquifex aeolicus]HIQ26715.1 RluA family pseudouridine synthase [Aquifex aeolicus]